VRPFAYERATDVGGAVQAAGAPEVMFLGGGTNLVDLMKLGVAQPARLIDVSRLPLDRVEELAEGGLRIGATVRNSDLAAHPAVRQRYPVLAEALLAGASGQIRNMATVGGNLLQRTRCPYFQDTSKPCNKRRPGSGCPAHEGENSNLAILGHSPQCVATHPSDMAVALAALGARVTTEGADGGRTVPIGELYRLPGEAPERDTTLARGELITGVELDPPPDRVRSRYRKARERASFAFALVSVAVVAQAREGLIEHCRVALGGVAHGPWRAHAAEAVLLGQPASEANFARAAEAELAAAQPLGRNGFKVPLARNLIVRTLGEVVPS
jgi:xanthine dehydrogenase YagS FAD-binding subunit